MKIIIKRDENCPKITMDLGAMENQYPYQIQQALWEALRLDGYTEEAIREVFNEGEDQKGVRVGQ